MKYYNGLICGYFFAIFIHELLTSTVNNEFSTLNSNF